MADTQGPDSHVSQYRPIAEIAARLDQIVPANRTVEALARTKRPLDQPIEPAIRYYLVRHGDLVLANGSHQRLGYHYELGHKPYGWLVVIANGSAHRKHMLRVITVHFTDGWGNHAFSAWVARVGPGEPRGGAAPPQRRGLDGGASIRPISTGDGAHATARLTPRPPGQRAG